MESKDPPFIGDVAKTCKFQRVLNVLECDASVFRMVEGLWVTFVSRLVSASQSVTTDQKVGGSSPSGRAT